MKLDGARWRKVTDIDREYALFELVVGDIALLDLGFDDEGRCEIASIPRSAASWPSGTGSSS